MKPLFRAFDHFFGGFFMRLFLIAIVAMFSSLAFAENVTVMATPAAPVIVATPVAKVNKAKKKVVKKASKGRQAKKTPTAIPTPVAVPTSK